MWVETLFVLLRAPLGVLESWDCEFVFVRFMSSICKPLRLVCEVLIECLSFVSLIMNFDCHCLWTQAEGKKKRRGGGGGMVMDPNYFV